jgi:hypothetical protein
VRVVRGGSGRFPLWERKGLFEVVCSYLEILSKIEEGQILVKLLKGQEKIGVTNVA